MSRRRRGAGDRRTGAGGRGTSDTTTPRAYAGPPPRPFWSSLRERKPPSPSTGRPRGPWRSPRHRPSWPGREPAAGAVVILAETPRRASPPLAPGAALILGAFTTPGPRGRPVIGRRLLGLGRGEQISQAHIPRFRSIASDQMRSTVSRSSAFWAARNSALSARVRMRQHLPQMIRVRGGYLAFGAVRRQPGTSQGIRVDGSVIEEVPAGGLGVGELVELVGTPEEEQAAGVTGLGLGVTARLVGVPTGGLGAGEVTHSGSEHGAGAYPGDRHGATPCAGS